MKKSIYSKQQKILTQCLIEARKSAEMTQQDVADALGKPQSFVAKYENGERRLDVIEFLEICEVISAKPEKIIRKILVG